jgi:hypothetical protein
MSFASSTAGPAMNLLRGGSLRSMAKAVGVIVGAGLIGATYQIAHDEGRSLIHTMRITGAHRRQRNEQIMLALMNSKLPIELQSKLFRSRDAFRVGMRMLADEDLPPADHAIIHATLTSVTSTEVQAE